MKLREDPHECITNTKAEHQDAHRSNKKVITKVNELKNNNYGTNVPIIIQCDISTKKDWSKMVILSILSTQCTQVTSKRTPLTKLRLDRSCEIGDIYEAREVSSTDGSKWQQLAKVISS